MNLYVVRYRRQPLNFHTTRVAIVEAQTGADAVQIVRDSLLRAGEDPNDYCGWTEQYDNMALGWSLYVDPPPGRIISNMTEEV